jgi:hypothetical protein
MKNEDELLTIYFTHHEAEHLSLEIKRVLSAFFEEKFPKLSNLKATLNEALNEQDHNKESSLS